MCKDCGCSLTRHEHDHLGAHSHNHEHHHPELHTNPQLNDKKTLSVIHKILDKNDVEAGHNRAHFEAHNITAFNLMSSPGSGKTTLLENLKEYTTLNYAVIEGDLETSRDADRLIAKGIKATKFKPDRLVTLMPSWFTAPCTTYPLKA